MSGLGLAVGSMARIEHCATAAMIAAVVLGTPWLWSAVSQRSASLSVITMHRKASTHLLEIGGCAVGVAESSGHVADDGPRGVRVRACSVRSLGLPVSRS